MDIGELKLIISAQIAQAEAALKEFGLSAEEVKGELASIHNKNVKILADTAKAEADLEVFKEMLKTIPDDKNVRIDVTKRTISYGEPSVGGGGGNNGGGGGLLGAAIMTTLPMAAPLAASGAAAMMGLASAFSVAAAGAAGFGAVAAGVLGSVFSKSSQITAAQQAYNKAVTSKQKQVALQQLKQAWSGMDQQQLQAVKSLRSFESFWKTFTKQFEKPVTQMFTNGLKMLKTLLKEMEPAIKGASQAFTTLEKDAQKALQSPFWKQFFSFLGSTAKPDITAFGKIIGNLAKGFAGLIQAFNPMAQSMLKGLEKMTAEFAKWATNLKNTKGFEKFIQYAQKNGPKLMKILGNLVKIIGHILVAMAPLGAHLLTVVERFTKWMAAITKNHPTLLKLIIAATAIGGAFRIMSPIIRGVIGTFQSLIGAMRTLKKISDAALPVIGKMAKGFGRGASAALKFAGRMSLLTLRIAAQAAKWVIMRGILLAVRVAQAAATAAQWLFNVAMDANPIGAIIAAIALLVTGIILLVTHLKEVRRWVSYAWNAIKHLGSVIGSVLGGLWHKAYDWGRNLIDGFIGGIRSMFSAVGNVASSIMHHVKAFLGFHSPSEKGPGQHIVEWGENMILGFTEGIMNQVPHLQGVLATALVNPLSQGAFQVGQSIEHSSIIRGGARASGTVINVTQHVHGSVLTERELTGKVADGIWTQMKGQGKVR